MRTVEVNNDDSADDDIVPAAVSRVILHDNDSSEDSVGQITLTDPLFEQLQNIGAFTQPEMNIE